MSSPAFTPDRDCAESLDKNDELSRLRRSFHLPKQNSRPLIYLCGHSLGLMPKRARDSVETELERWSTGAVEGHFGDGGWFDYHTRFAGPLAELVGAGRDEVVAMNTLTVNLHLMLVSFFRPQKERRKILIERGAFPSDRYAVQSHLRFHGLDPKQELIEFAPEADTGLLEPQRLEHLLAAEAGRVALILLPGVQFLSGQVLDLRAYVDIARRHDCRIGFDLAHAIGNVPLRLHGSGADFAVWCSYKYLNAGPGAVGGCFVHRRWAERFDLPRFAGWWGHDRSSRFRMPEEFAAMPGAEGWQLSNPPIFSLAPLAASLDVFAAAGERARQAKASRLHAYLAYLLRDRCGDRIEILTPRAARARGCQLSLRLRATADECRAVVQRLRSLGVVADWRPPDVLRLAPVPLYNRYRDVFDAVRALRRALR